MSAGSGAARRRLPYRRVGVQLRPLAHLTASYRGLMFLGVLTGVVGQVLAITGAAVGAVLAGRAISGSDASSLHALFGGLVAIVLPIALVGALELVAVHVLSFRLLADMRKRLYAQLELLAPAYMLERRSGDIASTAMSDVELLELFTSHVLPVLVVAVLVPFSGLAALVVVAWPVALVLFPFVVVVATVPAWLARSAERQGTEQRAALGALAGEAVDGIQGLREVVTLGAEAVEMERLELAHRPLSLAMSAHGRRVGIEKAATDVLINVGVIAAVALAALLFAHGDLSRAMLLLSTVLAAAIFAPILLIGASGRELNKVAAAAQRINALLSARPAVVDHVAAPADAVRPRVSFEGVRFRYPTQTTDALEDISFEVREGETVALVGHSGAGKSTCANLLLRLWDPASGRVTLGGHDLRDLPQEQLRNLVASVPQDVYLFNVSVRENLRLARPDATDSEIVAAAEKAQALEFIETLPSRWETIVGERGTSLSGGQRQRLAVARALLKDSPVLVLDEAVSNLDAESEAAMQAAIARASAGRTTLIIAHRPSTIQRADRIVVLERGRVAETGTNDELRSARGTFHALMRG